jgi:hypothetical protein
MKLNSPVIAIYILLALIPISYCIYLDTEMRNRIQDYEYLQSKAFVLEDKVNYEGLTNYNTGFSDGYESAKNQEKLISWQSSILTKGYESGVIKCYYVSSDGKQIEFPLTKWVNVEFPLNKWIPKK